jgi:pimeloyl-ACP methyl ester carboxylesterase
MRDERTQIAGVPTRLHLPSDAGAPRGLLLLGHGGGASKDAPRFVDLCRFFAERTGLAVACIDAVDHGDRRTAAVDGPGLPPRWHSGNSERMADDWRRTAEALADRCGPAVAYVGFSMGSIFGLSTVATLPGLRAVVFVVGGIPSPALAGIDDPPLRPLLLGAAARLDGPGVLLVNTTGDELFPVPDVHVVFDAIGTTDKRLHFWPGGHDDWPDEAMEAAATFITDRL